MIFDDRAFGFQGGRDKSESQLSLVFVLVSRFGAHIDVGRIKTVVPGGETAFEKGGVVQYVGVERGQDSREVVR